MRAAANHVIQATGAEIIKGLQIRLWDLQPKGIHPWKLKALNIHDELMTVHKPGIQSDISNAVAGYVEGMRETIPLIGMEWKTNVASWGEK
jgi:DNA polymerase I-like protein with 3'-5' exonuclease and polymerase domains